MQGLKNIDFKNPDTGLISPGELILNPLTAFTGLKYAVSQQ
jgi:hypothetical protein